MKLNDELDVEVSNVGIKVGCKTFPLSVVDELKKAVDKVKRNE